MKYQNEKIIYINEQIFRPTKIWNVFVPTEARIQPPEMHVSPTSIGNITNISHTSEDILGSERLEVGPPRSASCSRPLPAISAEAHFATTAAGGRGCCRKSSCTYPNSARPCSSPWELHLAESEDITLPQDDALKWLEKPPKKHIQFRPSHPLCWDGNKSCWAQTFSTPDSVGQFMMPQKRRDRSSTTPKKR